MTEAKDLWLEAWCGGRASSAGFHQWFTTKPLEVPWLSQKPSPEARCGVAASRLVKPPRRGGLTGWGSLTTQEGRSDRVVRTASRRSEAEDTRRDRIACVEAKRGAVPGCSSDEENFKFPKLPSRGVYRLKGIVVICHLFGTRYKLEKGGR